MQPSYTNLFTTPALAAIFSAEAHVAALLAFEAALARSAAQAGIIPAAAAEAITAACRAELFDHAALYQAAAQAGTIAIPLVRALGQQVGEAGRPFVHWGATSQDVIDTAHMIQLRTALELIEADLLRAAHACAGHAEQHRQTLMPARTLLQQALPITFGLKAARWLALLVRQITAIRQQCQGLVVQFGGAAGNLAALGTQGLVVQNLLAKELGLGVPDLPWHAERDRTAQVASSLAICAGAVAKIAEDVVLLAQSEVAEVSEAVVVGKGGSSAMPHKRNPVDSVFAIAAARLAIGQLPILLNGLIQEHERSVGAWQAEWQALPDLVCAAGGAVARTADLVSGLVIDPPRMLANLQQRGGLLMAESLSMALARHHGLSAAQQVVQRLCAEVSATGQPLMAVAAQEPLVVEVLSQAELTQALDPAAYLGSTEQLIDNALAQYRALIP
ncbi:MAG: 3-carboxy-cis,cis-muconate cycloisomerase [Roseiflexaceae bacterium]